MYVWTVVLRKSGEGVLLCVCRTSVVAMMKREELLRKERWKNEQLDVVKEYVLEVKDVK